MKRGEVFAPNTLILDVDDMVARVSETATLLDAEMFLSGKLR